MTVFSLPHQSPRDLPFTRGQTAILFVDMQNAWVIPGRDTHVDPQTHRYFYDCVEASVIPNQQRLLAASSAADIRRLMSTCICCSSCLSLACTSSSESPRQWLLK